MEERPIDPDGLGGTGTETGTEADADTGTDAVLETTPEPENPAAPELTVGLDPVALAAQLERVERTLVELARLGDRHADHVAALHAENQRLRSGELAAALEPMLRDVMKLHDDVVRLADAGTPEAVTDLEMARSLVLTTMDRWGLAPFAPELGDAFDPSSHHGVGHIASPGPDDGTIAAVRRCGFRRDDGSVVRPAEVIVHRHHDGAPTASCTTEEG